MLLVLNYTLNSAVINLYTHTHQLLSHIPKAEWHEALKEHLHFSDIKKRLPWCLLVINRDNFKEQKTYLLAYHTIRILNPQCYMVGVPAVVARFQLQEGV
jgi:hypothetical protein